MEQLVKKICLAAVLAFTPVMGSAQNMDHGQHMMMSSGQPSEAGQSAFAAIQEVVGLLMADPHTDWAKVDLERLRQHLIDMDNVTLRTQVNSEDIDGGAVYIVTSDDPAVVGSIQRMAMAHSATMNGQGPILFEAEALEDGVSLTATGGEIATTHIRGLGFIGLMAMGMHHQQHHLALATGEMMHGH